MSDNPSPANTGCRARAHTSLESLEVRRHFAVSLAADGWSRITPADDTRVIYVSSTAGDDGNDGQSPAAPVKSLARGQALVRDGSADWLLLRRGDVFEAIGDWRKSGRAADEPILIGAYGSGERPRVHSGVNPGFTTLARSGKSINNLFIRGISFFAHTYDHFNGHGGTAGIRLTSPGANVTIEDVRVAGYKDNIVLDPVGGTLSNVVIRRSVIVDAHAARSVGNGYSQGIYVGPLTDQTTIEQNIIDHNGWRQGVDADRIVFNHNVYAKNEARNVIIRDNVISQASFYGVKLNSGGVISGNFFIRNSESVYLEGAATVERNVITESVDMPTMNWAVGINTQKAPSANISRNLITRSLSGSGGPRGGIVLFGNGTPFGGIVERNVVYDWPAGIVVQTPGNGRDSVVIRNNQFQHRSGQMAADHSSSAAAGTIRYETNRYSVEGQNANRFRGSRKSLAQWIAAVNEPDARYARADYPDPDRDIAQFQREFGGQRRGFAGFIESIRSLSGTNWNENFTAASINAWYRGGFGRSLFADPPPPGVRGFAVDLSAAPSSIFARFTANVRPSLSRNDLRVVDEATGRRVPVSSVTWSAQQKRARFNIRVADLPAGTYRAVIPAGAVETPDGRALATDRGIRFTVSGNRALALPAPATLMFPARPFADRPIDPDFSALI